MILVDSNILIDLFAKDPVWMVASRNALANAIEADQVGINQIIVGELASQFASLKIFLQWISSFDIEIAELDVDAAYRAGLAFKEYRRKRRESPDIAKSVLPDFFIGGHAAVLNATILTRDPRFYRTYFPEVPLITPERES